LAYWHLRCRGSIALGAILTATRFIDASLVALSEMAGSPKPPSKDGDFIRAIVAGGGCGSSISISALLQSADNSVATMGCEYIASLVLPLLQDARGSAALPSNYHADYDKKGLDASREAALEIMTVPGQGCGTRKLHYPARESVKLLQLSSWQSVKWARPLMMASPLVLRKLSLC
jgi:hypothetical protein